MQNTTKKTEAMKIAQIVGFFLGVTIAASLIRFGFWVLSIFRDVNSIHGLAETFLGLGALIIMIWSGMAVAKWVPTLKIFGSNKASDPRAQPTMPHMPAHAAPERSRADNATMEQALYRPILFREIYPPTGVQSLSYYGGLPTVPPGFTWPRGETKSGFIPLHFVMQWDCEELATCDATGAMPNDGVLYLFCDLEWGDPMTFRFIHAPGATASWQPATAPADLGPAFGKEGAWMAPFIAMAENIPKQDGPPLLPKWPFRPIAIDYPKPDAKVLARLDDDERYTIDWNEYSGVAATILAAQNHPSMPQTLCVEDVNCRYFARPYPSFPQDWAAARIVLKKMIDQLSHSYSFNRRSFFEGMDDETRAATIAALLDQAVQKYNMTSHHPLTATPTQSQRDELWTWMEGMREPTELHFESLAKELVNISLGLGSDGVRDIPPEWISENARRHRLAYAYDRTEYEHEFVRAHASTMSADEAKALWKQKSEAGQLKTIHEIAANTPNHMFGPASHVQGDLDDDLIDHMLLLELRSNGSIGMDIGEGVLQFIIRPEDLRARRFDQAKLVISAY